MFKPVKMELKGRKETVTITLPASIMKDVKAYIANATAMEVINKEDAITPEDVILCLVDGFVKAQEVVELDAKIKKMKDEKAAAKKAAAEINRQKKIAKLEAELAKVKGEA